MKFLELRNKEVINVTDGKRLGFVCDAEVDKTDGKITAIIVPTQKVNWSPFAKNEEFVIPWERIKRLGDDIILVDID